jgi:hypothetical protein
MTIAEMIQEAIKEHTPAKRVQLCLQNARLVAYVSHVQLEGDKTIVYAGNVTGKDLIELAEVEAKHHGRRRSISSSDYKRIELLDGQLVLDITTVEII